MSARGLQLHGSLQGASHHQDLFESKTNRENNEDTVGIHAHQSVEEIEQQDRLLQEIYGTAKNGEDPLQLEHMIGYGGDYRQTMVFIPGTDSKYAKRLILHEILFYF